MWKLPLWQRCDDGLLLLSFAHGGAGVDGGRMTKGGADTHGKHPDGVDGELVKLSVTHDCDYWSVRRGRGIIEEKGAESEGRRWKVL